MEFVLIQNSVFSQKSCVMEVLQTFLLNNQFFDKIRVENEIFNSRFRLENVTLFGNFWLENRYIVEIHF